MREMKDSGAKWLGQIPKHWRLAKFKYHLRRNEPRNPGDMVVLSLYRELGIIPKDSRDDNHNVTSEDTSKYKYVKPGDFVVNKMKAWQGSVAVSDYEGIVSPAYYVYNFKDNAYNKKYFHYLLRGCYKDEFMRLSGGIRVGQWDLSAEALNDIKVLIPPMDEQRRIAEFLDARCAEIDELTAAIEREIATLGEYRRSVITESVTRGLDPAAPLKDSGVEWIGRIPVDWNVKKAKYCVVITNGSDPTTEGEIPVYGSGANSFKTCGEYKTGPTVLIGRKGATLHIPHYIDGLYWNVDTAFDVKTKHGFSLRYYYYLSTVFDYQYYISQTTLPSMTQSNYYNMMIPCPDLEVQNSIVDFLDARCAEIDGIIAQKQEQLARLAEYRKSIIYEYVTGKREVRG